MIAGGHGEAGLGMKGVQDSGELVMRETEGEGGGRCPRKGYMKGARGSGLAPSGMPRTRIVVS